MDNLLTVSPSPHVSTTQSVKKLMYGVVLSLVPAFLVSVYLFGAGALVVTLVSIASCVLFESAIQKYILKTEVRIRDGSAIVTGMLLAFNLPSNLPWWMIVIGALFAIGVGKMTYGGLGNNPFNPALVGRVFLLISFPVQMTSWPLPMASRLHYTDAVTGATPLGILKEAVRNGEAVPEVMKQLPDHMQLFLGQMGGSLGEVSAVALLLGFAWLLYKKIITWHIPVFMVGTVYHFYRNIVADRSVKKCITPVSYFNRRTPAGSNLHGNRPGYITHDKARHDTFCHRYWHYYGGDPGIRSLSRRCFLCHSYHECLCAADQ